VGEVWTIRPLESNHHWTQRPVTRLRVFARIHSVNTYLDADGYKVAFKDRLVRMRNATPSPSGHKPGMTQLEMATAIGVPTEDAVQRKNTYARWEQDTSPNNFPAYLLPSLCEVTGHDPWYVLTEQAPTKRPKHRRTA